MHPSNTEKLFSECSQIARGDLAVRVTLLLVEIERFNSGSLEQAMHHVATETGVSYWTIRDWHKSKPRPKSVCHATLIRILTVYQVECARQAHIFQQRLKQAKEMMGAWGQSDRYLAGGETGGKQSSPSGGQSTD